MGRRTPVREDQCPRCGSRRILPGPFYDPEAIRCLDCGWTPAKISGTRRGYTRRDIVVWHNQGQNLPTHPSSAAALARRDCNHPPEDRRKRKVRVPPDRKPGPTWSNDLAIGRHEYV
jgi:hypothetical protein